MKNNKAPGITGVTTDMLKNLPDKALKFLTDIIQNYWDNPNTDFPSWHTTKLTTLFKGKGSTHDPNNWRGICLKETSAKIVSSIIANHLLNILKQHGCPNQFGHVGCQEALHTVRSILTLCRHHGRETYALFIDLVKAFDSVNHEILYATLDKFGVPKDLMNTIRKMYSGCTIHLQVRKEEREIKYGTGVQQGDNMAPVLFLFIMQAAYETLQKKLTCEPFEFRYFPDNTKNPQKQNGHFVSQDTSSNGKPSINSSLYDLPPS